METYPYPKKRVYLSAAIAGLSIILASALFSNQSTLIIYYSVSTITFTVITFLVKKRLYTLILSGENEEKQDEDEDRAPWKAILIVLLMSLALFVAPLLLAGILSGLVWFMMIISFTSGVSISEIVLYLRMRQ
jgi:hypothetical protein